jgi:8-oxo-dGTP diphosphatase
LPESKTKQKAGVVAYRMGPDGAPLVLLVSSRTFPGSWVFPVGTQKRGESLGETAARECREESGYEVKVGAQLNAVNIIGDRKTRRFTFFLATVVQEHPDWETDRQRRWLPLSQLAETVADVFRPVARDAVERLRC